MIFCHRIAYKGFRIYSHNPLPPNTPPNIAFFSHFPVSYSIPSIPLISHLPIQACRQHHTPTSTPTSIQGGKAGRGRVESPVHQTLDENLSPNLDENLSPNLDENLSPNLDENLSLKLWTRTFYKPSPNYLPQLSSPITPPNYIPQLHPPITPPNYILI